MDWWCAPRFDSPSLLGRLLDPAAGHWEIRPEAPASVERAYLPGTMVLETVFANAEGRCRLTDALAFAPGVREHEIGRESPATLVRRLEGLSGRIRLRVTLSPRPDYGRGLPRLTITRQLCRAQAGDDVLLVRSDVPLRGDGADLVADLVLEEGDGVGFAVRHHRGPGADPAVGDPWLLLAETVSGWRSWSDVHAGYEGHRRDEVRRGALVLQTLTHQPTAAIVAAPTTSIPEVLGGDQNWDYRFAWLRDASLTLNALSIATCPDEVERNFRWMVRAAGDVRPGDDVQIVYGVEGERDIAERELAHLRGYRGSAPVRIGNDAARQVQLDVYGQVLDSAHLLREELGAFEDELAAFLTGLANRAADRWREEDAGIWEGREGERHYVTSKVMCWVALDRALALADRLGAGPTQTDRWTRERHAIRSEVLDRGWSSEAGAFSGAYGSDHLDASVLLMPIVGFLDAGDPRMVATVEAVERELGSDGLVRRWTGAEDGHFLICSFWLADCLARMGRTERAIAVADAAFACANDVGLFSEEFEPGGHGALGNFPQALSHVGAITAASSIDRALRGHAPAPPATPHAQPKGS